MLPFNILLQSAFLIVLLCLRTDAATQSVPWMAPASANSLTNQFKENKSATSAGKKVYNQLCSVCHGVKGKGDGVGGMSLDPRPADFTKKDFQTQSDGAIYWKITEGRMPMAPFKDVLSEEQRWELVNYLRTFKTD